MTASVIPACVLSALGEHHAALAVDLQRFAGAVERERELLALVRNRAESRQSAPRSPRAARCRRHRAPADRARDSNRDRRSRRVPAPRGMKPAPRHGPWRPDGARSGTRTGPSRPSPRGRPRPPHPLQTAIPLRTRRGFDAAAIQSGHRRSLLGLNGLSWENMGVNDRRWLLRRSARFRLVSGKLKERLKSAVHAPIAAIGAPTRSNRLVGNPSCLRVRIMPHRVFPAESSVVAEVRPSPNHDERRGGLPPRHDRAPLHGDAGRRRRARSVVLAAEQGVGPLLRVRRRPHRPDGRRRAAAPGMPALRSGRAKPTSIPARSESRSPIPVTTTAIRIFPNARSRP